MGHVDSLVPAASTDFIDTHSHKIAPIDMSCSLCVKGKCTGLCNDKKKKKKKKKKKGKKGKKDK